MAEPLFPTAPHPSPSRPTPVVRPVGAEPLARACGVLGISIHDVVNEWRHKRTVAELYRISRWIEAEQWLQRQAQAWAAGTPGRPRPAAGRWPRGAGSAIKRPLRAPT